MVAGIIWLGIFAVLAVVWLVVALCKLAGAGIGAARRPQARGGHRAARVDPETAAAERALVEGYQRQREVARQQQENAIDAELEEYRRQADEEERQRADREARTHRYRVTQCKIDALTGGEFTLETGGLDSVKITLDATSVMHFLSLKAGDIVQVTLAPGNAGVEEFWQLARANGAKPRSAVGLTASDMRSLGLTTARAEPEAPEVPQ